MRAGIIQRKYNDGHISKGLNIPFEKICMKISGGNE